MIDQTRLGHAFLKDEFNVTATIGWQIDPFGKFYTIFEQFFIGEK